MSIYISGEFYCSFCRRNYKDVQKIIAGFENSCICNQCVNICQSLLQEYTVEKTGTSNTQLHINTIDNNFIDPVELKKMLDLYIIGQFNTKKIISVAVYNHYKKIRINSSKKKSSYSIDQFDKNNILLIGPTGSGKTLFAKTLAKYLNVPFVTIDATTLTQAGYVGEDVENILVKLLDNANGDIEKAQNGIVYIDEIDKISKKTSGFSFRDVSGEGVQQSLLKLIEGSSCLIPKKLGKRYMEQEYVQFNTQNVLFICAGSFVGIENSIKKRVEKNSLVFNSNTNNHYKINLKVTDVFPDDLITFGLIPELVGRLPVVSVLNKLKVNDLLNILLYTKNSILQQYKKLFMLSEVKINFTLNALKIISKGCLQLNTGARGLKTFLEKLTYNLFYYKKNLRFKTICIDSKFILKHFKNFF